MFMVARGSATIHNEAGIHCRPSTHILKAVQGYPGRMRVSCKEGDSDLTSMLGLMMLSLTCGTQVEVEVEGPDEEAQLRKLIELLETEYDFPQ
jgi:phosphotransferase system HPr (HPr) family protein